MWLCNITEEHIQIIAGWYDECEVTVRKIWAEMSALPWKPHTDVYLLTSTQAHVISPLLTQSFSALQTHADLIALPGMVRSLLCLRAFAHPIARRTVGDSSCSWLPPSAQVSACTSLAQRRPPSPNAYTLPPDASPSSFLFLRVSFNFNKRAPLDNFKHLFWHQVAFSISL